MRRACVLLLALAPLWCGSGQKRKASRPPEVRILEVVSRRTEGIITVDGRVSNCGTRTIVKLTLVFHFRTIDGHVVTTQRGVVEAGELAPGQEGEFFWQMKDHARAVDFIIEAVEGADRELIVERPGPYPLE